MILKAKDKKFHGEYTFRIKDTKEMEELLKWVEDNKLEIVSPVYKDESFYKVEKKSSNKKKKGI